MMGGVGTPVAAPSARRSDPAAEAWEAMSRVFMATRGRMLSVARELDLSPPQVVALRFLHDGRPMGELAEVMHCDNSNITGIVDRLEQRGLVERRPAQRDRRVKLLLLTEEGTRVRQELEHLLGEPPPGIAGLSRADQRALRDILRRALALD